MPSANSLHLAVLSNNPKLSAGSDLQRTAALALAEKLAAAPHLQTLLDSFPEMVVLLDENRRIVALNMAVAGSLGDQPSARALGRRVGDLLGCVHAHETPGGCGTTEYCGTCLILRAVKTSQERHVGESGEARVTAGTDDQPIAWELFAKASPFDMDGHALTVFAVRDMSAEKRRATLEKIFFHDTLNTAGSLLGSAEILADDCDVDVADCCRRIEALSRQLIEQIRSQRALAEAERGELAVRWTNISVADLFHELHGAYQRHPAARNRHLVMALPELADWALLSDPTLLQRVLGNLVKNALEATHEGETVTVSASSSGDDIAFQVSNPGCMPRDVQLQVFQRSFSTKGEPGRGLGTFSVKLLTGRYLRGSVHFTSSAEHGTVFTVTLPRQPSGVRTTLPAGGDGSATRLPPTPQAKPLLGRCLLLVDDLPENRRLIGYMLRAAGAEVVTADGGGAALAEAEAMRHTARMFDAILLDMDMPDIDGFEVARTLREQQEICPIVALTAFDDESDRQSCIAAGCTFHLSKPVERLTLIAAVQRICDDGSS